jgi:Domain of unknown function (DUF4403)
MPSTIRAAARRRLGLALVLFAAACDRETVNVPAPAAGAFRPLPEPEASVVTIPITLALDSVVGKVEDVVPNGQSREDEWHSLGRAPVVGMLYVKEKWEREPLALTLSGDRVEVGTTVRYRARIAERACVPVAGCRWVPLAACGHDGAMPSLRVGLVTTMEYRPDWSVVPETRAQPVRPGVRCLLTRARVDVTDRVIEAVQAQLNRAAPRVDGYLREKVALRGRVEGVWASLQRPIDAGSGVFLQMRPESVAVAPPRAQGARLSTDVTVTLRPRLVVGERPAADSVPLPNFVAPPDSARGLKVAMVAELPYATANELLAKALIGRSFDVQGHKIQLRGVRLYGAGERLVLALKVGGDARGTLYFVGTPVYDPATQTVSVPDLDFSVETKNVLAGPADWLLHERMREQVRAAARFGVGDRLAEVRQAVNGAINRNLSDGVRLTGAVENIRPLGVVVTERSIATVVEAGGRARIDITIR